MTNLSPAAQAALINAAPRQGALVDPTLPLHTPGVLRELEDAGMILAGNGLTRAGVIARQRVLDAKLDAAF
jgi:hypothetical protein